MLPDIRAFLDRLAEGDGPPIYTLLPDAARQVLRDVQDVEVDAPATTIEDLTVPGGPTGDVAIRIVRPANATGTLPAVMYFPRWRLDPRWKDTHDRLIRELACALDAAIVFVDYALSPEAQYPTAIEQAYAATRWVAAEGASAGLDAARLVAMGDSVGGNMTAVFTLMAKERGGPTAAQVQRTRSPMPTGHPSYEQFADGSSSPATG